MANIKEILMNRAVPGNGLLNTDDTVKLKLDSQSWDHLKRYADLVQNISLISGNELKDFDRVIEDLQKVVVNFGSPEQLRQLLVKCPDALQKEQPDGPLYVEIVWLIQHLHMYSIYISSVLKTLAESPASCDDVKNILLLLGSKAQEGMDPIPSLISTQKSFSSEVLNANNLLSNAYDTLVSLYHPAQEAVGGLQYKVDSIQKQIDELGRLFTGKKRKELELQLQTASKELSDCKEQAQKYQTALAIIEPVLVEGKWLDSALNDIAGFLQTLRSTWADFGSGVTQVATASDAQLSDRDWVKKALGLDQAITQWDAIAQASSLFRSKSLDSSAAA